VSLVFKMAHDDDNDDEAAMIKDDDDPQDDDDDGCGRGDNEMVVEAVMFAIYSGRGVDFNDDSWKLYGVCKVLSLMNMELVTIRCIKRFTINEN
jgi:hypothetical protein